MTANMMALVCPSLDLEDEAVIKREIFIESCAERKSSSIHATFFRLYTFCVLSLIESLKCPCSRVLMRLNRVYAFGSHVYILDVPPSDYERVFLLAFVLYIFALSKLKRGTREDDAIVTAAKSRKAGSCAFLSICARLFACCVHKSAAK